MRIKLLITPILILALGCSEKSKKSPDKITEPSVQENDAPPDVTNKSDAGKVDKIEVKPLTDPVLYCDNGKCKTIERTKAREKKLSLINLSDNFTPYIFSEKSSPDGKSMPNLYRKTYLNLAQDLTDEEGRKLNPSEHNYLELYGIPPTMSVLRKRFMESADSECAKKLNPDVFKRISKSLYWNVKHPRMYSGRYSNSRKAALRYARRKKIADIDKFVLEKKNRRNKILREYYSAKVRYDALKELQNRFICEHVIDKKNIRKDYFDQRLKNAVRTFERKHMVYGWGYVNAKLLKILSRTMLENDYAALKRMLRERVAHSLGIFDDGSIRKRALFPESTDLIHNIRDRLIKHMGIDSPEKSLEFFRKNNEKSFNSMWVAIPTEKLPPYYSENMNLTVKTSIGDVWYDVPYSKDGKEIPQPRKRLPRVYLYVIYKNHEIPLMRMGTTAGGWQKEYVEKEIFLKYKSSDLGAVEWKFIVGGPVWFPPHTTPPRELLKFEPNKYGIWKPHVKPSAFGPSYASAYGLAMGIHTITKKYRNGKTEDLDHGIRTHGSVNYMSILIGHSHGCHRLHNHLAVRMFSNILQRRPHVRMGQQETDWRHFFPWGGKTHKIELKTKGYYYELTPPIRVVVGRGAILGKQKKPIRELVRIPNKEYREDLEIGMAIGENGILEPVDTEDSTALDENKTKDATSLTTGNDENGKTGKEKNLSPEKKINKEDTKNQNKTDTGKKPPENGTSSKKPVIKPVPSVMNLPSAPPLKNQ
ncbi:MAG: hypothetical protein JXR95_00710 [Deltaproteobacteria bacterium]|nr:hypothetical protein [Deltaproteobacteria bacterium]